MSSHIASRLTASPDRRKRTETRLLPEEDVTFDLGGLKISEGITLAVIVNPNKPNGGIFDMARLQQLLCHRPNTRFLVDEAFIGMAGRSAAPRVPRYANLLVPRALSKAHRLAGFRIGYAILPEDIADDLNGHNDAYPLARPSQAAAIATLLREDEIRDRVVQLRVWTEALAAQLAPLGVRTYPTRTYFFLADLAPHDATEIAAKLRERDILIKPLNDPMLGPGFVRITTALPEDNRRFIDALREVLAGE